MVKCTNEQCNNEAVFMFDHVGKKVMYCFRCFGRWNAIMDALGTPMPIIFTIDSEGNIQH